MQRLLRFNALLRKKLHEKLGTYIQVIPQSPYTPPTQTNLSHVSQSKPKENKETHMVQQPQLSNFTTAQIGDKVYSLLIGKYGKIINIDLAATYPIGVSFAANDGVVRTYTLQGQYRTEDIISDLYWTEPQFTLTHTPKPPIRKSGWIAVDSATLLINDKAIYPTKERAQLWNNPATCIFVKTEEFEVKS